MDIVVAEGRPESLEGRLEREVRVYDYLDKLGMQYTRADHEPAETMEQCLAVDEALGTKMCKNLFLCNRAKTDFYLLLMPGDIAFKTKELRDKMGGERLSFASEEFMLEFLDIKPGAVSVMGLMNDKDRRVSLIIEETILAGETVGVHPCVNTSSLKISVKDLKEKYLPAVKHNYRTVKLTGIID